MTRDLDDLSDADLITRSRDGDKRAYGVLWKRHWHAARAMAASITGRFDPDDLASEAFARILKSIEKGNGPTTGFRSYLATTVRNVAIDWSRRKTTPTIEDPDIVEDWTYSEVTALERIDRQTIANAFYSLPDSWQEVLWYTEVEDMAPREVAPILGLTANAVSALALRAREGLRQAWINAHLAEAPTEDPVHSWTLKKLGPYVRGKLNKTDRRKVVEHLDSCTGCTDAAEEADHVGSRLALGILPLFLGIAGATAYTAWTSNSSTAVAATLPPSGHPAVAHSPRGMSRLRHLVEAGAGSTKTGVAAVAATVVTAAALTAGTVIAAPQEQLAASQNSEGSHSASESPKSDDTRERADAPRSSKPKQHQLEPRMPSPEAGGGTGDPGGDDYSDGGDTDPRSGPPDPGRRGEAPPELPAPPQAAPVLPTTPPRGCEAAVRLVPADQTLFAYRLDEPSGAPTASDLVHGGSGRYDGSPGDATWSLTDETQRPPTDEFTAQIWFKADAGGGRLLGFTAQNQGVSAYYDRQLFLTDDGRLVFGVYPDEVHTVASAQIYTDDRWHQATATLSGDGMALYVDGQQVANDSTVTHAQDYAGFWRIGYDNLDNWGPETPTTRQVSGSLAFAAVYGAALSAEQVAAQWESCI